MATTPPSLSNAASMVSPTTQSVSAQQPSRKTPRPKKQKSWMSQHPYWSALAGMGMLGLPGAMVVSNYARGAEHPWLNALGGLGLGAGGMMLMNANRNRNTPMGGMEETIDQEAQPFNPIAEFNPAITTR